MSQRKLNKVTLTCIVPYADAERLAQNIRRGLDNEIGFAVNEVPQNYEAACTVDIAPASKFDRETWKASHG